MLEKKTGSADCRRRPRRGSLFIGAFILKSLTAPPTDSERWESEMQTGTRLKPYPQKPQEGGAEGQVGKTCCES
jgi:hypothetical protein